MAKQLIPLVKSGYLASHGYIPLVHGNGLTTNVEPEPEYETLTGDIVTFNSLRVQPLESLSCTITPVQDLHGQSSPYPAGGGKNKLPLKDGTYVVGTSVTLTVKDSVITASGTAQSPGGRLVAMTDDFTLPAGTYYIASNHSVVSASDFVVYINKKSDNTPLNSGNNRNFTISEDTIVFAGVNVTSGVNYNGVVATPMLNVGNTAEPYAPYANLCPISGWSEAKVTRTGKNLLDPTANTHGLPSTTLGDSVDDIIASTRYSYSPLYNINGKTVTITIKSADTSKFNWAAILMYNGGILVNRSLRNDISTVNTFATNAAYEQIRIVYGAPAGTQIPLDLSSSTLQIEFGSTPTTYSPCTAQTVTIALSGTRYGGTLDVKTGLLTITEESTELKNLPWDKSDTANNPNGTYFYVNSTTVPYIGWATVDKTKCLCNALKPSDTGGVDNSPANSFWWNNASTGWRIIYGLPNGGSNVSDLTSFLTTNNVILVAPLATPLSVQLSANELETLLGQNNVWADTGSVTLTYQTN